jgi:type II secretory pathway component GspD/PulD (secretin)
MRIVWQELLILLLGVVILSVPLFSQEGTARVKLDIDVEEVLDTESRVVFLKNAPSAQIQPFIQSALTSYGSVRSNDVLNALIITDVKQKIDDLEKLAKLLDTPDLSKYRRLETTCLKLKYTKPSRILPLVEERLSGIPGCEAQAVDELNLIVITDVRNKQEELKEIIEKVDKLPRQIMIEIVALELDEEVGKELGINWSMRYSGQSEAREIEPRSSWQLLNEFRGAGGIFEFTSTGVRKKSIYDFLIRCQNLVKEGKARVVSRPRIVTLNNLPAETGSRNLYRLQVTPQINEKGLITLRIDARVSDVTAQTCCVVEEGQSFILGGLLRSRRSERVNRLPILGNIPVIGWLFSHKDTTTTRQELLFIITPRILSEYKSILKEETKELIEK